MAELTEILSGVNARIAAACAKSGRSPGDVEIIAVTKTHGPDVVREAWDLLEVNMSGERSKSGMRPDEAPAAVERALASSNITLEGFMTMAPFVPEDKVEETRPVFAGLRELRDRMETQFGVSLPRLSMGMSGDFAIAVEEGATWVRLGTVLFGERPKVKPQRTVDAGDAGESGEGGGEFDRVMD